MNPIDRPSRPVTKVGHYRKPDGASAFRVYAPGKKDVSVVLTQSGRVLPLSGDAYGYWTGETEALPHGTLYRFEVDGRGLGDPASRRQPNGVHGDSQVTDVVAVDSPGWAGVKIEDAILYELHVGTFTPEGTLAAAASRLEYLRDLGITVVELMPLAAFPGERNWGYDGTYPFALHQPYGDYPDLKAFIERSHELGMAVLLDVVYNHFGPEGNYSGAFAPYTKRADTPWGAAINFDGPYSHGVREFFLDNTRYWLEEIGFDGLRMDAVALIFDNMPVHILRQCTDLAREIGRRQQREVLMVAEHLHNNKHLTGAAGYGFHTQWNDDLNHAVYAFLTNERQGHYGNFGSFDDIVRALEHAYVLDGTRFDQVRLHFPGGDAIGTLGTEHVVHIQDHDQVGNRALGDRMITTHGRDKALLGITAVMASAFVPMLFMGEEYGETAPFLFFEDFADADLIEGVRKGRAADYHFAGVEPADPHARATFEACKLQWQRIDSEPGRSILDYYRRLIAMKRSGILGPRDRGAVQVHADGARHLLRITTKHSEAVLNFSGEALAWLPAAGWRVALRSGASVAEGRLAPYEAVILEPDPAP